MSVYTVPAYLRPHREALPRPAAWTELAVCATIGDDALWYPEEGIQSTPATSVCRSCEARLPCLRDALRRNEQGVWGGFSERARKTIAREHRAGRSLEDLIAEDDAAFYVRQERSAALAEAARERRLAREQEKRDAIAAEQDQSRKAEAA